MEIYSQVTLADIYVKPVYAGGITRRQLLTMYIKAMDRKENDLRFQAAIHGVKMEDKKKPNQRSIQAEEKEGFTFKSPDSYKHLTDEQKKALTDEMKGRHKNWQKQGGYLEERK